MNLKNEHFVEILQQALNTAGITLSDIKLLSEATNQAFQVTSSAGTFFLKVNFGQGSIIFQKEAKGLEMLRQSTSLTIPEVVGYGSIAVCDFLLLAFIPSGRPLPSYWEALGTGLAQLHRNSREWFGLDEDNFIVTIPQPNQSCDSWLDFFLYQRIDPLLKRALDMHLISLPFLKKIQASYPKFEGIFPQERPALLHGDLWSGNILCTSQGQPCLIDPAIYFGHREVDLAFSRMFGGFDQTFYESYHASFPLQEGFESRVDLYNLYPLLVHLILFGRSYLPGIESVLRRFE